MALLSIKVGMSAFHHLTERQRMKERDREIEQEREKERHIEKSLLDRNITIINHFSHEHILEKAHLSQPFTCNICHVSSSSSSWAYTCKVDGNCSYFLHAVCAASPVTLRGNDGSTVGRDPSRPATGGSSSVTTFAHRLDHPVKVVRSNSEFHCDHCFTTGKGRHYKCEDCDVNLHSVCVKNPTRLSTFMHPQHELELRTKKRFNKCQICGHSLRGGQKAFNLRVYGCNECQFWVHPMCSQLPQYLLHDLHSMTDPPHPLQLKRVESSSAQCDAKCGSNCGTGWQYVCTLCSASFHIECILNHSVQDSLVQFKSDKNPQFPVVIGVFLELADVAGFGVFDAATCLLF